jgi:hypothetical protein
VRSRRRLRGLGWVEENRNTREKSVESRDRRASKDSRGIRESREPKGQRTWRVGIVDKREESRESSPILRVLL